MIKSLQTLVVIMCMVSCTSYSRLNDANSNAGKGSLHNILYYASLAASSHNTQPWKVEVYGSDTIIVYPDLSRKLTIVDPHSRKLFISLGTFLENMDIAANHYGYGSDMRICTHDSAVFDSTYIVVILHKEKKHNIDVKELGLRRVFRSPFDTLQLEASVVAGLVAGDPLSIHFLPSCSAKGAYVKQKTIEAYSQQAHNENAQDELACWIRFSNADVRKKKDGLTTSGMEIKGIAGFIVRNFFKPDDAKKETFVEQGIEKTRNQANHCGGWLLVTQKNNTPECWIRTGRLIQRINLQCRSLNVGFHPMFQMIEETDFEQSANATLGFEGYIQFVARVGYVKTYSKPVSMRRSVESFTVFR
jgi:hypothetical protein